MIGRNLDLAKKLLASAEELPQAGGKPLKVLSFDKALSAAMVGRQPLRAVELEAVKAGVVPGRYLRHFHALTKAEQALLLESAAAVAGLGGLGGLAAELLARAGVGRIKACDGDFFADADLNRQLLSTPQNLGEAKAEAAGDRLRLVNPATDLEILAEGLDRQGFLGLLEDTGLAVDCLDGFDARRDLLQAASERRIPLVSAGVAGFAGWVSTVLPGGPSPLDLLAGEGGAGAEIRLGVMGPAASLAASVQAAEGLRILTGGKPSLAGRMLLFDLSCMSFETVELG